MKQENGGKQDDWNATATAARTTGGEDAGGYLCFLVPDDGRHAAWSAFNCEVFNRENMLRS